MKWSKNTTKIVTFPQVSGSSEKIAQNRSIKWFKNTTKDQVHTTFATYGNLPPKNGLSKHSHGVDPSFSQVRYNDSYR